MFRHERVCELMESPVFMSLQAFVDLLGAIEGANMPELIPSDQSLAIGTWRHLGTSMVPTTKLRHWIVWNRLMTLMTFLLSSMGSNKAKFKYCVSMCSVCETRLTLVNVRTWSSILWASQIFDTFVSKRSTRICVQHSTKRSILKNENLRMLTAFH